MTEFAVIHVWHGVTEAWPIAERVTGGWQSGSHGFYSDAEVLGVTPLTLDAEMGAALHRHVAASEDRIDLLVEENRRLHAKLGGAA